MKRPSPCAELTHRHLGLSHFDELRAAARQHRAPAPEAVEALAAAACWLYADAPAPARLEAFGRALGMFQRPGKGRLNETITAGTYLDRIGSVGAVIQAERGLLAEGMPERRAKAKALRDIAVREGITHRTLSRWLHDMRADAEEELFVRVPEQYAADIRYLEGPKVRGLIDETERMRMIEERREALVYIQAIAPPRHD